MYEWVRPRVSVPVHGEARHLEEHAVFAKALGASEAIAPRNGDLILLAPGAPRVIEEVPSGKLLLDGDILMPQGSGAMRERRKLSYTGMVTISLAVDSDGELATPPRISMCGVPAADAEGDLIGPELQDAAEDGFESIARKKRRDDEAVEIAVQRAVRTRLVELWGKRAAVGVVVLRV
jgi:ribonuclease J